MCNEKAVAISNNRLSIALNYAIAICNNSSDFVITFWDFFQVLQSAMDLLQNLTDFVLDSTYYLVPRSVVVNLSIRPS